MKNDVKGLDKIKFSFENKNIIGRIVRIEDINNIYKVLFFDSFLNHLRLENINKRNIIKIICE